MTAILCNDDDCGSFFRLTHGSGGLTCCSFQNVVRALDTANPYTLFSCCDPELDILETIQYYFSL